jgi:hypothetical protein
MLSAANVRTTSRYNSGIVELLDTVARPSA